MRLYRNKSREHFLEECFYIELQRALVPHEIGLLKWLISDSFDNVSFKSRFRDAEVVEIGPRLSVETPFSSSAVAICQSMGLPVKRIEMSTRYQKGNQEEIIKAHLDSMTQTIYESSLTTFDSGFIPDPVSLIPVIEQGEIALGEANTKLDLKAIIFRPRVFLGLFCVIIKI